MPLSKYADTIVDSIPGLQEQGAALSKALHRAVLDGGPATRKLADALHGTWLGHPIHAMLTDVVVGAWVTGAAFDVMALAGGGRWAQKAGDALAGMGLAAAVPTAVTGVADYSAVPQDSAGVAALHAALNGVNVVLYACSMRERRRGRHGRGAALSLGALALTTVAAWLGGHLVYSGKVGTDHAPVFEEDAGWKAVLPLDKLPDKKPKRVTYADEPVLLYRDGEEIYALANTCAHAGGPLDEGEIKDCTVRCPWHDSVFDLRDGAIVYGPTVHRQPSFQTRVRDGQIELMPREA